MKKLYSILMLMLIISLIAAQCGSAPADESPVRESGAPQIKVMEPYARASIPNGAVYMHLMNEGGADDRLVSVESNVAEAAELHETKMGENDVMQMRPIEAVNLPAGGSATLEPGGMHVMLMGLTKELAKGDTFELTLNFENSESQTIQVEVTEGMAMEHDLDHSMEEGEMNQEHDMEHNMESHNKIPNNGAVINIVSPEAGTEIAAGEMVMIKVETEGFDLGTDNHWHLYVDGELVDMIEGGKTEAMLHDLEPGQHTIMTTMADSDHNELEEGAMISVVVK